MYTTVDIMRMQVSSAKVLQVLLDFHATFGGDVIISSLQYLILTVTMAM